MSPPVSLISRKIRENSIPKMMLCEHPPHFHRYLFVIRLLARLRSFNVLFGVKILYFGKSIEPHPHDVMIPSLQARVTACATPALKMEYAKLDSRYPKWHVYVRTYVYVKGGKKKDKIY